jgi:peptide/nickel transport system ATP-binding protein
MSNAENADRRSRDSLSVKNLTVRYETPGRNVTAVDNVSFDIQPGEIFGLAGESGCGKSTVVNAIMRLMPSSAEVTAEQLRFGNTDILSLDGEALRRFRWSRIAMVFQSAMNSLNPVMTIGDQLRDGILAHVAVSRREATERAAGLLELVGLSSRHLASYPHELSGGMRQRCVIAIALALRPPLLILDEPTTALDVVVQQDIMQQILELQSEFDFSVLFITHDISLVIETSHRLAVMYRGRLVEVGEPRELLDAPRHPYTSTLMGAFPPLTGPREHLTGLADTGADPEWARSIPDLSEVTPGHWVAETATAGSTR